jgi:nicotinate-nucleotide adenylyltransferase
MAGTAPAIAAARDARPTVAPRIGLFGGSFDPVHRAHVQLARQARDTLGLDEVRWIPAGQPWQKARAMTPAVHREAMVREAIAGEPRFVLDRIELERNGPSYTLDTVRALQQREPGQEWLLMIGAGPVRQPAHLARLARVAAALVVLAVAGRPGVAATAERRCCRRCGAAPRGPVAHAGPSPPPTSATASLPRRRRHRSGAAGCRTLY